MIILSNINKSIRLLSINTVLMVNGIFSVTSGMLITVFSEWLTAQFGLESVLWFAGIGLILVGYGSILLVISRSKNPKIGIQLATIGDLSWVVLTSWILVDPTFFRLNLTPAAMFLIVSTSLIVLDFALIQLHLLTISPSTHTITRIIDANVEETWAVIADLGGYQNHAKGLIRTEIIETENDLIIRECEDRLGSWRETCSRYKPLDTYTMEVDTSDYPYPFTYFSGTWSVKKRGSKTQISVTFSWVPKGWIFGKLIMRILVPRMIKKGMMSTFDNYEKQIMSNRVTPIDLSTLNLNTSKPLIN